MTSHTRLPAAWAGTAALLVAAGLGVAPIGSAASHRHEAAGVAGTDPAGRTTSTSGPDRTSWLLTELARAGDGATIEVPPGTYRGPLIIDRAVRLHGAGRAHLRGDGRTHTVEIRARRRGPRRLRDQRIGPRPRARSCRRPCDRRPGGDRQQPHPRRAARRLRPAGRGRAHRRATPSLAHGSSNSRSTCWPREARQPKGNCATST